MLITISILTIGITLLAVVKLRRASVAGDEWSEVGLPYESVSGVDLEERERLSKGDRTVLHRTSRTSLDERDDEAAADEPSWQELSAAEAIPFIEQSRPHILDVRTPGETASGFIPGAHLIPIQDLPGRVNELLGVDGPMLVYCAHGVRSLYAIQYLAGQGFGQLHNLSGGVATWSQPLERPQSACSSGLQNSLVTLE